MRDRDEKVVECLMRLGLPAAEAKLYAFLLKSPGLNLRQISEHLKISIPRVYKLIANLKSRGLMISSPRQRSKAYFVVPPAVAASVLTKGFEEKFYTALNLKDELVREVKVLGQPCFNDYSLFEYTNRHAIIHTLKNLIEESRGELMSIMTAGCLIRSVYLFKDEIRSATSRGVKVFILAPFSKAPYGVMLEAMRWGECREVEEVEAKVLLKDSEEAFLTPAKEALNEGDAYEYGVHIRNRSIVNVLRRMFTFLWHSSQPITPQRLRDEVGAKVGVSKATLKA